ncbi:hypothetical protein SLEP1_g8922 [Rubroshorea leprosula]|uniref:Uncharacterized protein n=1 Tax=Rubroshorea leprosula TaxID=152421 RepID=A0AAV5IB83_9ROSI|nr:hypothetical protein SLEP1_g8922 [Rubroshorea leprosula]
MAAPFFSTPFQPHVYQSPQDTVIPFQILGGEAQVVQSPQDTVIPFQILGGEAQVVQIMLKPKEKVIAKPGFLDTII